MVTLKEYEAYLKVKRFIDAHDEAEIISRLMVDNKYVPLIIENLMMLIRLNITLHQRLLNIVG